MVNQTIISYHTNDENLKDIDDQNLKNYMIENYLMSMISIQTFYFRGEKWLQFLKMIIDYNDRIQFLTHFITFIETKEITSYQDLQDKIKDIPTIKYPKHNKKILEIYNKIIEINEDDFFTFLTGAAELLLRIDKIENYLRAVDTKKDIDTTKNIIEIKGYESITKLQRGIQDFNDYVKESIVNLPFLDYRMFELNKINKLERINFSLGANLFNANLSEAELSGANLFNANLSNTVLRNSIIIRPQNYESIVLNKNTIFNNAISDNIDFIYHISKFTENIPDIVNNKKELKLQLEKRQRGKDLIEHLLIISNLPRE